MGYNTYKSIGKALPERINIVLSTKKRKIDDKCILCKNIQEAMYIVEQHHSNKKVFFIGGSNIYEQVIDFVDEMYITEIDMKISGNKKFPTYDKSQFEEIKRIENKNSYKFDFVVYKRKCNDNEE